MKELFLSFMHWWTLTKPKIFRKKLTGKVWKMWEHKGWGNTIEWSDGMAAMNAASTTDNTHRKIIDKAT